MSQQTRIILLRHGETLWNTEQRFQGHRDSSLTQRGIEQAKNSGFTLQRTMGKTTRLVCSPLGRCRQTVAEIARVIEFDADQIEYDERVKERSFGQWEGHTLSDVKTNDAQSYRLTQENRWDVPPPDGESYAMVAKRLSSWLNDIQGQSVVLVSHGCAGRILRGIYAGLTPEEMYSLDEPHEAIYKLENNKICRVT